jgi:hypothetical protein
MLKAQPVLMAATYLGDASASYWNTVQVLSRFRVQKLGWLVLI